MSSIPTTFPRPDRSKTPPNTTKTEEKPEVDIGWNEGFMADGLPYRAECWAMDQITMLTFFFSTVGKESWNDEQLVGLLVSEGLVSFPYPQTFVQAVPITDDAGQDMWSINVVIGDEDNTYADSDAELRAYG